jgi:hypothetical protein
VCDLSNGVQEGKPADGTSLQACLPCQLRDKVVKHKQGQQPEMYTLHLRFHFPLPCFFGSRRAHFFCRYALFALLKFPAKSPTGNELYVATTKLLRSEAQRAPTDA